MDFPSYKLYKPPLIEFIGDLIDFSLLAAYDYWMVNPELGRWENLMWFDVEYFKDWWISLIGFNIYLTGISQPKDWEYGVMSWKHLIFHGKSMVLWPDPCWGADATHLNLSCSLHAHGSVTLARCWLFGVFMITKKSQKTDGYGWFLFYNPDKLCKFCSIVWNGSPPRTKMTKMN